VPGIGRVVRQIGISGPVITLRVVSRRTLALMLSGLLIIGLLLAGWKLPVPYVVLSPGPVSNTLAPGLIQVSGHKVYPTSGKLFLTTVYLSGSPSNEPTLFQALDAWLRSNEAVLPIDLFYPPNQSESQVNQQNVLQMVQSQQDAISAALTYLGYHIGSEVVVASVDAHTPAARVLKVGDVVLAVDGHPVHDAGTLHRLIQNRPVGATVRLTLLRSGRRLVVTAGTIAAAPHGKTPIVGFVPLQQPLYPFHISIGLKNVEGPSAGLMFALGIIDKLSRLNLTDGRVIAGTGEITPAGQVQEIGGIQEKIAGAAAQGARIFLVPSGNCSDARRSAPSDVLLVRVQTLSGAVGDLQALKHGGHVPTC
jgi:PDZ domain-containing protein